MKKFLLVDGNSLLHRAYHAFPGLVTSRGQVVGAVYGFSSMLLSAIERVEPDFVAVTWDVSKRNFRHVIYKEYKAGRAEMEREMFEQIDTAKSVVEVINIPQFGLDGFEADDLIGTLTEKVKRLKEVQVVIATGDRDSFQLLDGTKVVIYMPVTGWNKAKAEIDLIDEDYLRSRYGLRADQIIDLKALMGDTSDNVKGVPGIGEVTALKLMHQFASLDKIYMNLDKVANPRIRGLLIDGKDLAYQSKELVTIKRDVPIDFDITKCRLADYDRGKALKLFQDLEFKSLVNKLPKDDWEDKLMEAFS